jgi:hypothetical protein
MIVIMSSSTFKAANLPLQRACIGSEDNEFSLLSQVLISNMAMKEEIQEAAKMIRTMGKGGIFRHIITGNPKDRLFQVYIGV